jgi:putative membrane-bound dehydrogenase-like protein
LAEDAIMPSVPSRLLANAVLHALAGPALAGPPTATDDRLVVELVASEPDIVTPTGIAVDEHGAVWVVENQTHQRTPQYKGPETDRIRVFSEFGPDGKAGSVRTFADGFRNSMSIALGQGGAVFLATRAALYRLRDGNGSGKAGERTTLVRLETAGDYPHNGLAGFAFDAVGNMYFGLGENLGADYKLIGSDGVTLAGGGEGGSVYRCRPDGTGLVRVATGFWNPFAQAVDALGRLLIVDNDPDARGPCRLVHVIDGGDYGYRFRYGRKGLHPFVCWNGELPGTLPMIAGTLEAPSGILPYEADGLPADYRGKLLTTSWGDHVVECFELSPRGASVGAKQKVLVRGGEDFRPVGIAAAPDGSVVFSDWVDKSYPVHGKGRIWRLRAKTPPDRDGLTTEQVAKLDISRLTELLHHPKWVIRVAAADALTGREQGGREALRKALREEKSLRARLHALWATAKLPSVPAEELVRLALGDEAPEVRGEAVRLLGRLLPADPDRRQEKDLLDRALRDKDPSVRMQAILQLRTPQGFEQIVPVLADADPFLASAALTALGRPGNAGRLLPHADARDARLRVGVMLALRASGDAAGRSALPGFLRDSDPGVRRAAIQWVGEERLREHAELLRVAAGREPVTREVFAAWLAAETLLAGGKSTQDEVSEEAVLRALKDQSQTPAIRALSLRMLRPDHPGLKTADLQRYLEDKDMAVRLEAARTLAMRPDPAAQELLRKLAAGADTDRALRPLAVAGLGHSAPTSAETRRLLLSLLDEPDLRRDALRSLRTAVDADTEKAMLAWWDKRPRDESKPTAETRELAAQLATALRSGKGAGSAKVLADLDSLAGGRPQTAADWRALLGQGGDAAAGERLFFHARGPGCAACHRIDGRGGATGPDLSAVGAALGREKLIESIVEPSKEIAPQFVAWQITTRDGKVRTGTIVAEGFDSTVTVADAQGKIERIAKLDIEERTALAKSIMPDNLHTLMTPAEFRDLLAFLQSRK